MTEYSTDLHSLYEAAVQSVDADLDFIERVYRWHNGGERPRLLREDFCGTASLACSWAGRRRENRAWGVDLHPPTLEWGREHRLQPLGKAAERVELLCQDVRDPSPARVDAVAALNFSFCIFKERAELGGYFAKVHDALRPGGVLVLDLFGGTESCTELEEESEKEAVDEPDGRKVRPFTYVWEQARFNPIDHHILCHIHFRLRGGRTIRRAFTYDWRLWTLPELRDLLEEAGFDSSEVYAEGWDDESDESDGIFRRRKTFDNDGSWIAYVVGFKGQRRKKKK